MADALSSLLCGRDSPLLRDSVITNIGYTVYPASKHCYGSIWFTFYLGERDSLLNKLD